MDTDNPVSTMGNQGSKDFDSAISETTQQQGTTQESSSPIENVQATNASQGMIPRKQAPKDDGDVQAVPQAVPQGDATTQTQPTAPAATTPQTQADIIRATAEAVAQAHVRAQQAQQPTVQAPAEKELSPEEFNKKFSVTRANEELVTTILGPDPRKAALALDQYGQNLVKQAILMTMELQGAELGRFRQEVTPHLQSWQTYQREREARAAEERFFKSAPDLANEKELVMELKDAFIAKVQAGQVRFTNETEAFNAVANAARSILKRVNPAWGQAGAATSQAPTQGQPQARRMSVASTTGRSGSGQAAAKSDADLVFGADAR